jgi:hypothetical protein
MNRRKAIKLILLGSASVTSLISYKWLDKIKSTDIAYLFDKQDLIAELAETIIPETDTPGAKTAQVQAFIIRMLTDCADPWSLNNFITGMQELEEYSLLNYKRSFAFCTAGQKQAILQEFERRANPYKGLLGKVENKIMGRPFFTLLKTYTVMGYCTSQLGATQALRYESIPGRYENVLSTGPRQRSWATK